MEKKWKYVCYRIETGNKLDKVTDNEMTKMQFLGLLNEWNRNRTVNLETGKDLWKYWSNEI